MVHCDECRRFHSNRGLLVRSFECDLASLRHNHNRPLDQTFSAPRDGIRFLDNASLHEVAFLQMCALRELAGANISRPSSALRASNAVNRDYTTYGNNFGLVLSEATNIRGAYSFDAWTTLNRRACANESEQAAVRLRAVEQWCENVSGSAFPNWALERRISKSPMANCRFHSVPSMLRQQEAYQANLLLSRHVSTRCSYVEPGGINQVSAVYNASDVTGVFYLEWEASHLPLVTMAFAKHMPWLMRLRSEAPSSAQYLKLVALGIERGLGPAGRDRLNCTCHHLPRSFWTSSIPQEATATA